MSCMAILFFYASQITRSDIKAIRQVTVSLAIADGHLDLPQRFVWEDEG